MSIGMTILENQAIETAESVAVESIEWASDTGGTPLDASSGESFMEVLIQVSVTFNASATGDAKLHLRKSADGGTTESTENEGTYAMTIPVSAGNTVIKDIMVYDFTYLDVGLENEDATYTCTYTAIWAGKKLTGLATS